MNTIVNQVNLIVLLLFSLLTLISCNKEGGNHSCYDETLVHNNACLTDCPGFKGCDGKTYCNECEAARKGIREK